MSAVITISSSPERMPPRTPAPPTHESRELYHAPVPDNSPESIISPSELCRLPMRSKYFEKESLTEEPRTDDVTTGNTTTKSAGRKRKPAGEKQQAKERKATTKTVAVAPRPSSLEGKQNAPKKTTEAKKKRVSKGDKSTNKVLTGRVAKAGGVQSQDSDKKSKAVPASECSSRQRSTGDGVDGEEDGFQLEAAMRRRLDWTPTRDTPREAKEMAESDGQVDKEGDSLGFGNLVAGYNFSGTTSASHNNTESSSNGGPTKRRRIDLVESMPRHLKNTSREVLDEESTEDASSDKTSEPKKKPRRQPKKLTTITARMTARYQNDYSETYGSSSKRATDDNEDTASVNSKGRKSREKGASKSKPEVIILSPEEAVKSVNEQDLVFGTCSQLEREDSPTELKDLQAAIRESEKIATASPSTRGVLRSAEGGLSSTGTVSRFMTPKNLWSVAARDLDGSLIDAEVLDLTESPQTKGPSPSIAENSNIATKQDLTADLSPFSEEEVAKSRPPSVVPTYRSKGILKEIKKQPEIPTIKDPEDHSQMPNYDLLTDIQLSKKVAEFGFKPVKARRKMIELLEKCWKSQNGTSAKPTNLAKQPGASAPESQPPATKKKTSTAKQAPKTTKPKDKPKSGKSAKPTSRNNAATAPPTGEHSKDAVPNPQSTKPSSMFSYKDVEEIEDSEEEIIPSPSRLQTQLDRLPPPKNSACLPVSTNPSSPPRAASKPASGNNNAAKQNTAGLADRIAKAVRAQPGLTLLGARNGLTWQEKIVMYDPIIIEDFTAWLNTEGLGLVNEDREVNLAFVRQWCEQRGICCCYRRINKR